MVVLMIVFATAIWFPFSLSDQPLSLDFLKDWQAWYGAILGFGGLIAVSYYNGLANRRLDIDRYERENRSLAIAIGWETFGIVHRASWASARLNEQLEKAQSAAGDVGWDGQDPHDIQINPVGHEILQGYVPPLLATTGSGSSIGRLGDVAAEVQSFATLVSQARETLKASFTVNERGQLSFANLDACRSWLENVSDDGIQLFTKLGSHFPELNDQFMDFAQQAQLSVSDQPPIPVTLEIDASQWTGRRD